VSRKSLRWYISVMMFAPGKVTNFIKFVLLLFSIALSFVYSAPSGAQVALRVGVSGLPPSLGNPYTANGIPSAYYWHAIFDTLTVIESDGRLVAALATGWERVGPTTWRFDLRKGVTFSNGERFDSKAVEATLRWLTSNAGVSTLVGNEIRHITLIESLDPYSVLIHTRIPDPILPKRMAAVFVFEPSSWERLGPGGFALKPVGSGSFKLEAWRDGLGRSVLLASPSSWRPAMIDRLEFAIIPDLISRLQALISGQIDLATAVAPDAVEDLDFEKYTVHTSFLPGVNSLAFRTVNNNLSPVINRTVRQALNLAVDKNSLSTVLAHGRTKPGGQGATATAFGFNPDVKPYPYDPERARELLAAAGYAGGFKLTAEAITGDRGEETLIYQSVAQNLREVGVELEIRSISNATFLQQYVTGSFETDMFSLTWNTAPLYDAFRPLEYFSCARTNPFFCETTVIPKLEAARSELDSTKRLEMLRDLQAEYHALAPAIFLLEVIVLSVSTKQFENVPFRSTVPIFHEIRPSR